MPGLVTIVNCCILTATFSGLFYVSWFKKIGCTSREAASHALASTLAEHSSVLFVALRMCFGENKLKDCIVF